MEINLFDKVLLFEALSDDDRKAFVSHFVPRAYPKNSVIINEGDNTNSLYVILEGRVKVYLTDEYGKQVKDKKLLFRSGKGELCTGISYSATYLGIN